MHDLILIDPLKVFLDLLAFGSFVLGWTVKGLIGAVASEIIFRPIARRLKAKGEEWEETHPTRVAILNHYIELHEGNHSKCLQCQVNQSR